MFCHLFQSIAAHGAKCCILTQGKPRCSLYQPVPVSHANKRRWLCSSPFSPFFIAGLCFRGLSVSVIRIWGLSWLTYVLSLLVQPFPPLTHIAALTQGERAARLLPANATNTLATRTTNTSLKASISFFTWYICIFIKTWCQIWSCEHHTRVTLSMPASALIIVQNWRAVPNVHHNYPTEKQIRVTAAFQGENKMAADCFLKELTWPDPLEPSHLLNGWHFICFVPVTTESPERRSTRSPWYCHK